MRKLTSRERVLLMAFIPLIIIGVIYSRGNQLGAGSAAAAALEAKDYGDAPEVELAKLETQPEGYDPNARNLFAYYTPPPPTRKVVERPKPVQRVAPPVQQPVRTARQQPPKTPPKAQPPRPSFRYIGFLGPKENKIAVLEQGDEVILAALGEVVQDRFTIAGFEYETLIIGFTEERFKNETTELPMKR